MNRERIETVNTIWEFDLDRKVYIRIPKNESLVHPEPYGKPYEGHEVAFLDIILGNSDSHGMRQFFVTNAGRKFGDGSVTQSWAVAGQDLTWADQLERGHGANQS
jgi:hypothetical protein